MQIKEAIVFNFGKLQKRQFHFDEGINVIYGENEQGKTTLHAFLLGMLFGMEKGRGRSANGDAYNKYEPWHAPSFYSGALRFSVDGKPFYLERNFYNKEKSEYLRNEADWEELSVAYGDLEVLLGGIGRGEFANTYDIPQSGAATGKAMSELLAAYLAEAKAGGIGEVHVMQAQKQLAAQKRECALRQKELEKERKQALQQKLIELEVQQETAAELRKQMEVFEEKQAELEAQICFNKRNMSKSIKKVIVVWLLILALILMASAYWKVVSVGGLIGISAAITVGMAAVLVRSFSREKDDTEALLVHAKDMLEQMKEHLRETENEIFNMKEEIEGLKQESQAERELSEDVKALELAQSQIEKIAEEYYLEVADELNAQISKWISLLTKGTYDSARLGEDGRLWILAEQREVLPEALSRGTLEQIYLALRLAAGSVLMEEEEMPIFLDEAFAMYDDVRLKETLKALAKTGKQVLLFTCQKREAAILREEGIPYREIDMAG